MVFLSQPRLFRDALSRSIEEQVDELLEGFVTQLCAITSGSGTNNNISNNNITSHRKHSTPAEVVKPPPFILFYFSDHLLYKKSPEFADNASDDGYVIRHASAISSSPLGSLSFRSPLAFGSPATTAPAPQGNSRPGGAVTAADKPAQPPGRSGLSRAQSNMSMRSIYASTRSLFPSAATRDLGGGGKRKKKAKKNAVMDHVESQVFQRVVHLSSPSKNGDEQQQSPAESESNCSDAIIYAVVPFVKQVIPLFFNNTIKLQHHSKQQQQQQQPYQQQTALRTELNQINWKNFALEQVTGGNQSLKPSQGQPAAEANSMDLVAWKQGNCLVIYPDGPSTSGSESEKATMSEGARLRRQRERKAAVVTLFYALEPLVQALMISRT